MQKEKIKTKHPNYINFLLPSLLYFKNKTIIAAPRQRILDVCSLINTCQSLPLKYDSVIRLGTSEQVRHSALSPCSVLPDIVRLALLCGINLPYTNFDSFTKGKEAVVE